MSRKLDEIERSVEALAQKERARFVADQLENKVFRTPALQRDFIELTASRMHGSGQYCFGPDYQVGTQYVSTQYESQPWLHQEQPAAPKPSVEKPNVATPAGQSGKREIQIEDIGPRMSNEQVQEAWAAIQRASGIEPNTRRYRP